MKHLRENVCEAERARDLELLLHDEVGRQLDLGGQGAQLDYRAAAIRELEGKPQRLGAPDASMAMSKPLGKAAVNSSLALSATET